MRVVGAQQFRQDRLNRGNLRSAATPAGTLGPRLPIVADAFGDLISSMPFVEGRELADSSCNLPQSTSIGLILPKVRL